jgi:diadenosine tetraphosphatase ApaH/serine/threonine PP2A family protein phosphatase
MVTVGSVGQPRDGDARLSYALFDGQTVTFVRLEYDHAAAAAAIRAVPNLPERLASRLAEGR